MIIELWNRILWHVTTKTVRHWKLYESNDIANLWRSLELRTFLLASLVVFYGNVSCKHNMFPISIIKIPVRVYSIIDLLLLTTDLQRLVYIIECLLQCRCLLFYFIVYILVSVKYTSHSYFPPLYWLSNLTAKLTISYK